LSESASLEQINQAIYVHGDSWPILPMELAPSPFAEHGPARETHLRSEDPDTQSRVIPLMGIPNRKMQRISVFIFCNAIVHAPLEFGDQTIKIQGRPFQNMMVCVALAEEFLCGEKVLPVLEGLRTETSVVIRPWNFWFPIVRERLLLRHERIEPLAILVPDFHHAGALGIEVLFVAHRVTLGQVFPAVYHTVASSVRFLRKDT
jgi:hypothetical protein